MFNKRWGKDHDPNNIRCVYFGTPAGVEEWYDSDGSGRQYPFKPKWEACTCSSPPNRYRLWHAFCALPYRVWRWFLARFRLDLQVVCEESEGLGPHEDYHDYPDDAHGLPLHFCPLKCKRCGKEFYI